MNSPSILSPSSHRRAASTFALSAFAVALAACGSSGGGDSAASTSGSSAASGSTSAADSAPAAAAPATQYVFGKSATTDGLYPYAALLSAKDGNLYGTTFAGGANNSGTVFRVAPGGTPQTLYSFGSADSDGTSPIGGLVQAADGTLYGTTSDRGLSGRGTVFKLASDGTLTTLHAFGGSGDGATPAGTLALGSDGALYGTTRGGGAYDGGTVFRIAPSGETKILYSFAGSDGSAPDAGLVLAPDGNFYGTTPLGGTHGEGTLFRVTPTGTLQTLHQFSAVSDDVNADGALPYAGLALGRDGALYGTTSYGGSSGYGTAYRLTTAAFSTLHAFAGGSEGAYPRSALVADTDGSLIGTTSGAGSGNGGTLFRLTPAGAVSVLQAFTSTGSISGTATSASGSTPYAALVKAADGGFYGTTLGSGGGTLYRLK